MEKQLTAKQLAELLNVSLRTLESLIATGQAPGFYWVGKARRWDPAAVKNWISAKQGKEGSSQTQS